MPIGCWWIITQRWSWALVLWLIAVGLDLADGWLARRLRVESVAGRLLDHGSDAVFVTGMLAALAYTHHVTLWLPCAIALAFGFYLWDHYRDPDQRRPIPHWFGKFNGVSYYVLIAIPLLQMSFALTIINPAYLLGLSWLSLFLTMQLILLGRLRRTRSG